MSSVIQLDHYRDRLQGTASHLCDCGCPWFELEVPTPGTLPNSGAVMIAEDGHVTGYMGELVCTECRAVQQLG